MEMETKVISIETIKPSSPTPKSLQKHQLSLIDQFLAPPLFGPFVYFYSSSNPQTPYLLKKSLSQTLSRFYPFAGRLVNNLYVDCNDAGVPFAETVANCDLSQVITDPDPKQIKKRLLYKIDEDQSQDLCMAVQATYFRCGGLALGLLIQHKIADASSIITFANSWAAVARNGDFNGVPTPKFDAATYFPQRDDIYEPVVDISTQEEEVATKIFTFSAAKIDFLREKYSGSGGDHDLSRVEALLAHIWRRRRLLFDERESNCVQQVMNLRSRMQPPLSEYHIGNIITRLVATVTAGDDEVEVVRRLGRGKKGVHDNYAAQLKDLMLQMELMKEVDKGEVVSLVISSLCGFPLYKADFGWGQPLWVVSPGFPVNNVAIFTDTKTGAGIQVLMHLSKPDMDRFQADLELQFFKSKL